MTAAALATVGQMSSLLTALDGACPDRADAISIDGATMSFADLRRRAEAVGSRIAGMPAVGVYADPTLDTVVAVTAGILAGVPIVPLPPDAGPVERGHIVRDAGAVATLGPTPWADVDLPAIPTEGDGTGATAGGADASDQSRAALIMYTSGTTGLPKGAILSRGAIAADLDGLADAWGWTADDHLVHGLPLFHVHGLILGVLGALRFGSRLTHTGRPTPAAYAAAGGSLYFGVPTVWSRVVGDPGSARALSGARLLVSGSAPLPVSVFEGLRGLTGRSPVERYGMTETLITVSTRADGERRPGHVGLPIAGVETRLVADDGRPCPTDGTSIGGLQVRGVTMFDGYVGGRRGDVTADGWFVTGDAATIDAGGFHRIVGRASVDIIKSGGFKVGAGEVEAVVIDHPGVQEVAVVGVPDDDLGQRIVAVVAPSDGAGQAAELAASVLAFARERLTAHKCPREVRVVDALPRNTMGKVLKAQLASG